MSNDVLDLTGLGETLPVKRGGKSYTLSMDMPVLVHTRIRRWVAKLATDAADGADEEQIETEAIDLIARVLKIDLTEAAEWSPLERRALLLFLGIGDPSFLKKAETSSDLPSSSPALSAPV